jgi:hypothetical protein
MPGPGRPFEPGNKLGRGRPPGSRNRRSVAAQELLDGYAESVIRQSLVVAMKGDHSMLRTLLGYVLPRRRDLPVKTGTLRTGSTAELSESSQTILKKVASGQLTPSEALVIGELLESRRRIIETEQMETRLRNLEQHLAGETQ